MSSATPSVFKGSCFCKGVQYEASSSTSEWNRCHCTMCRKLIGAETGTFFAVPTSKLQVKAKDTLKEFRSSEAAVRSFCGRCGCSVFMVYEKEIEPDTTWIHAATLDQEIPVVDPAQIYLHSKAFWLDTISSAGSRKFAN